MFEIIKPDSLIQKPNYGLHPIFLAGSIIGAEDWQVGVGKILEDYRVTVYNPRRDDWDNTWVIEEENPEFNYQVNWEMEKLVLCADSGMIFMYFDPESKSPITLLELGRFYNAKTMIVCCPDGFWRKGNVDIFCNLNSIPLYNNLEKAVGALRTKLYKYKR